MDSPFSALVEWVTSPQVVGSFVLGAVGLALSTIFLGFSCWAAERDFEFVSCLLGAFAMVALLVTVICLCCFNSWFAGVQ